MPATHWYRSHPYLTIIHGVIGIQAGGTLLDSGLLDNRLTDSDSVCWRLLGSTLATQRYKGRLCGIKAQAFADISGGGLREHAGGILLDGRLLPNRMTDSNSVCRRLLASRPVTQRYKGRPCGIKTQDFADISAEGLR